MLTAIHTTTVMVRMVLEALIQVLTVTDMATHLTAMVWGAWVCTLDSRLEWDTAWAMECIACGAAHP